MIDENVKKWIVKAMECFEIASRVKDFMFRKLEIKNENFDA